MQSHFHMNLVPRSGTWCHLRSGTFVCVLDISIWYSSLPHAPPHFLLWYSVIGLFELCEYHVQLFIPLSMFLHTLSYCKYCMRGFSARHETELLLSDHSFLSQSSLYNPLADLHSMWHQLNPSVVIALLNVAHSPGIWVWSQFISTLPAFSPVRKSSASDPIAYLLPFTPPPGFHRFLLPSILFLLLSWVTTL